MNNKTLSIFLNTDRVYITGLVIEEKRAILEYIDSTNHHFDFENTNSPESKNALGEIEVILNELPFKPDRLTVTIPSESIFVTKFPIKANFTDIEYKKLIEFEIRQNLPQFNYNDFYIKIIPIEKGNEQFALAMIYLKNDFNFLQQFFSQFDLKVSNFEISQLAAHNSFMFNYPEMREKNVLIIGLQGLFLDYTVINNGNMLYYNLNSLPSPSQIGEITEKEYNKIVGNITQTIDACYFFGGSLNKDLSMALWETSMMLGIMEAKRLNPFRMMTTNLDKRHKEYCSRTFHIFPPCIGSALKDWHKVIVIE